ncbi:hypothetical protein LUZ60_005650 [Juncus effusus]|nr:hypothetical protein LUZ60_005650 [Juncus effusus]
MNYEQEQEIEIQHNNADDLLDGPQRCLRCGISANATPHMRRGPEGRRTLCNACGIAWAKGKMRKVIDTEAPLDESTISQITPSIGMEFESEEKAYEFYNRYAGQVGFSVRKSSSDKSVSSNLTRSRTFVCSREGFRKDKKGQKEVKKPRPETRIGCPARLTIKIAPSGTYSVVDFVAGHNHQPAPPCTAHMLRSQRVFTDFDANVNSNNSDDSSNVGNNENIRGNFDNLDNLGVFGEGYSNVIRVKRMREMGKGDCGAILKYLMSMQVTNPNFYYAIQVDEDDKLTNIFWADEKMREDFRVFGDVVCFDVSCKGNSRPLVLFLGVNNHKQVVLFGAGFIYDESFESYKWLFETFNIGMKLKGKKGRNPKTVLSDNNLVVINAISIVWPRANFRVCTWHVYQNACKNLNHIFQGSKTFSKDFAKCIYECETEEEFINGWRNMVEKYDLINNEYLIKLFNEKHIWAEPYSRDIFTADIKSSLQTETLTNNLKKHLNPQLDLFAYFKHFERALEENRYAELQADFNASQSFPRIPQSKLLKQAANFYTPNIFEIFRKEFEMFVDSVLFTCNNNTGTGTGTDYRVGVMDKNSEQFVRFEINNEKMSVFCSCKKFEYMGIVCCHVLKVLDFRNIKELPRKYFLKRWGRNARVRNEDDDDDDVSDEVAVASVSVPLSQHEELEEQETHHLFSQINQDHAGSNFGQQAFYVAPQLNQGYSMQGLLQSQQFLGNSSLNNGNNNSSLH